MCCFVILLLSNEMQMSVRRFSAIPHLREKLIVRLEVVLDSARLVNSFERDDQVNAERIPHLESPVRQLQILLKLMGNVRNKSSFMYLSPKSGHFLYLLGNFKKLLLLFTRHSKSNPIELNFNRTQSNSIELNSWIEFD